jgi:hypothetical protein
VNVRGWAQPAAAIVGAALAIGLFWFSTPVKVDPCAASGAGNTPLGTTIAISPPSESRAGTERWYNFSILSGGGGLRIGDIRLDVVSPSGGAVALTGSDTVRVTGSGDLTVAEYAYTNSTWLSGGATVVSNVQTIILGAISTNLSGDSLVVMGPLFGPCGSQNGSLSVAIP